MGRSLSEWKTNGNYYGEIPIELDPDLIEFSNKTETIAISNGQFERTPGLCEVKSTCAAFFIQVVTV